MTQSLMREVRNVQNAALGSLLIWRFSVSFTEFHQTGESPALPLGFMVLPLIWHNDTFEILRSTLKPTGLHGFADKFSRTEIGKADLLFSLHSRAEEMRAVTIDSIRSAIRYSLLTIDPKQAFLIPLSTTKATGIASTLKPMIDCAEKLGMWFSQLSLYEISSTLKVSL